jgi:two-component system, OmpR family, sensor histidine kinase KdpD
VTTQDDNKAPPEEVDVPKPTKPRRGRLRIYLGAAPGVGKPYAMLGEAQRRAERGTDVVVGYVETYGRPKTEQMLTGLEIIPRRTLIYRDTEFTEMDLDAVLARRPQVALVDELAHTNVPGSRNTKRWQDIDELLNAGIDVLSTVNIQHLDSLNDVIQRITGTTQRETVPDEVVRRAEQIELVDITPEALRRRLAHGNIYPARKIDAALGNYFRAGNLTALRELALLWVADQVDVALQRYRAEHAITDTWETRERVVVAITGGPESETLIRRARRIAAKAGGELLVVHVLRSDGLTGVPADAISKYRRLAEDLGGTFHTVVGDDVPTALLDFARGVNAPNSSWAPHGAPGSPDCSTRASAPPPCSNPDPSTYTWSPTTKQPDTHNPDGPNSPYPAAAPPSAGLPRSCCRHWSPCSAPCWAAMSPKPPTRSPSC